MIFEYEPTSYAQNLAEYAALDEIEFKPADSKDTVINKLKEISHRKKDISSIQNRIIAEYIERFENGKEKLDDGAADRLYTFMTSINDSNTHQCIDAAISLRLCRLLYDHYHSVDVSRTIEVIYLGTYNEMQLSYDLNEHGYFAFPRLCEEYLPSIKELSSPLQRMLLDAYSKSFLCRNEDGLKTFLDTVSEVEDRISQCLDIVKDRKSALNIYYRVHLNIINLFNMAEKRDGDYKREGTELIYNLNNDKNRDILEKSLRETENGLEMFDNEYDPFSRINFRLLIKVCSFHLGFINYEELLSALDEIGSSDERFGSGGLALLFTSIKYLEYLYTFCPYSKEEEYRLARKKIDEVMPLVLEMKKQKNFIFGYFVLSFLIAVSRYVDFEDFFDTVLAFTVYADKALYVHTIMVKEISQLLLKHVLKENPELLDGVCGWNKEYIISNQTEVIELMDRCAICHDIGKHFLLDIVSNSSRRLTDDEFNIIKLHPQNYETVWEKTRDSESTKLNCIRDCALLHHRWHNEEGGYPDLPQTDNRPFVDILAIADSLDAATDSIGRPYGSGKSLDDLIAEFIEMGGTRYSREVAELLLDPYVRDAVENIITERREDINYRIFAFNEL